MPGVLGVYTGRDLVADGLGAIPPVAGTVGRDGKPMFAAAMPVLAVDRIRYVGEPVAIVVAQTRAQAQDAAERVADRLCRAVERAPTSSARPPPARRRSMRRRPTISRSTGPTATPPRSTAAFANAAHVERVRLVDTRLAPASMEPRSGIGHMGRGARNATR